MKIGAPGVLPRKVFTMTGSATFTVETGNRPLARGTFGSNNVVVFETTPLTRVLPDQELVVHLTTPGGDLEVLVENDYEGFIVRFEIRKLPHGGATVGKILMAFSILGATVVASGAAVPPPRGELPPASELDRVVRNVEEDFLDPPPNVTSFCCQPLVDIAFARGAAMKSAT